MEGVLRECTAFWWTRWIKPQIGLARGWLCDCRDGEPIRRTVCRGIWIVLQFPNPSPPTRSITKQFDHGMWTNAYIIMLINWHLHRLIHILIECRPRRAESPHWHRPRPCGAKPLSTSAHESSGKASTSKPIHTWSERTSKSIQTQGSLSYRSELLHSHQTRPHRADLPHPHQPKPHQVEPLLPMILIRPGLICLSLFIHKARPCWAVFSSYDAGGCCSPDAGIENSRSRQFRFIMSRWDRSTNQ